MSKQLQLCKKRLLRYGRINTQQALDECGSTRLSDLIFRLRAIGWDIETIPKKGINIVTGENYKCCDHYKFISEGK